MSKSIERQIDVYTKTREDIRKILQLAKACSVNDRIKLFNEEMSAAAGGGGGDEEDDETRREQRAAEIRREIEEAKEAQKALDDKVIYHLTWNIFNRSQ